MAEQIVSPGVFQRENDQSFLQTKLPTAGAAIVGPTPLGQVGIPTIVTTYSDYLNRFGSTFLSVSNQYTYFTSIAAYNYFQNGGDTLLVTRVVPGAFTSATSTTIGNGNESGVLSTTADELLASFTSVSASAGAWTAGLTGSLSGTGAIATLTLDTTSSISTVTVTTAGSGYVVGETVTCSTGSLGYFSGSLTFTLTADDIVNDNALTLETLTEGELANSISSEDSDGALASGSKDNLRWEISTRDESKGTFTLLVRRGNDTTNEKAILETWTNLTLDPQTPNFVTKVIGDLSKTVTTDGDDATYISVTGNYPNQSRYIRVKSVASLTPNYFDNAGNAKTAYTGSIPVLGSGSFESAVGDMLSIGDCLFYENIADGAVTADNTQGLIPANYTQSLALLANKDEYKYNSIAVPGLCYSSTTTGHTTVLSTLMNNSQTRGDNLAIIDTAFYGSEVSPVVTSAAAINSSYASTYWPWLQTPDPDSGQLVWVPSSTLIPSVFAFNDSVSEPWFAPAGLNRGALNTVVRAERKLPQSSRDTLYDGNVNPIATFPNTGVVVYGQKTLQVKSSALDRVNVRRLLIALKNFIGDISQFIVFEQNTISTRNQFLSQVNPYLESVQQRQGLYAFKVVMDESNNTPDVIDRNQLVGQIFIQPIKTAEFIILDYNILPTGATFPS